MASTTTEVSQFLDVLGSEPGSILYRSLQGWETLPPGAPGQILSIDEDGLPAWIDP